MDWWRKLKKNPLARLGAIILLVFYLTAIFADFIAPYNPYDFQRDGSLLPPTQIYWQNADGQFIGPHVYPTSQGPTDIETGDRELSVDRSQPSPVRLFAPGDEYNLFQVRLPLPPRFEDTTIFPGIPLNIHLFGAIGPGKINILGTDEKGRDQF
ncbi:MAG: ABC transporter permease, partial [Cyanobacteria bacterium P01_E01_bin.42]